LYLVIIADEWEKLRSACNVFAKERGINGILFAKIT
jgi:hypothetical protein